MSNVIMSTVWMPSTN